MKFETVKYQLKHEIDPEETIFAAVDLMESYNLKYWMANSSLELITYLEALSEPHYMAIMEEEPSLAKMAAFVKSSFFDANRLLASEKDTIQSQIDTAIAMRDALEDKTMVLTAYGEKTKLYEYVLNRKEGRWGKYDKMPIDRTAFTNKVLQYIISDNDPAAMQSKIKFVYGQLPVRLTRGKFLDWIGQALMLLRGVNTSEMDDYCRMIEDIFYPEGVKGYGEHFLPLHQAIDSLEAVLEESLGKEEAAALFEKIGSVGSYIEDAISLMLMTATMFNNMVALLYSVSKVSLAGNEEGVEAFKKLMDHLSTKAGKDVIDKTVVEHLHEVEKVMEKSLDELMKVDGLLEMISSGYDEEIEGFNLTERTEVLLKVRDLGSANYFLPLEEKTRETAIVDDGYVRKKTEAFREVVGPVLEKDGRALGRARIANVLGMLNVIHNTTDDIREYVSFVLNQCSDENELKACMYLIEKEISQTDY